MGVRLAAAAAALITVAGVRSGGAQSVGRMLSDDFTSAARDVGAIWSAPFDASGRDWLLTAAAFGAFGVSMFADQPASDWAIRNDSSAFFRALKPVRRGGVMYSGKYVVPPIAAIYVLGLATKNQGMRDFVMGCMSSWGAQSAIRKGMYHLLGRARPDTLPDDPQDWKLGAGSTWQMHSFPAGHFANILACATYWNKRFKLGAAGPALYAVAAAVGVGRMADRGHWMSDTVLGGILGYAVGSEVARRSLGRQGARALTSASLYVAPDVGGTTFGMRWTF